MWKFPKQVSLLPMRLWKVGRLSLEIGTVNALDGDRKYCRMRVVWSVMFAVFL